MFHLGFYPCIIQEQRASSNSSQIKIIHHNLQQITEEIKIIATKLLDNEKIRTKMSIFQKLCFAQSLIRFTHQFGVQCHRHAFPSEIQPSSQFLKNNIQNILNFQDFIIK